MEARGLDMTWGRSLYRRFVAAGLVDVGVEGHIDLRPKEGRQWRGIACRQSFPNGGHPFEFWEDTSWETAPASLRRHLIPEART